jgi:hypothetical protein
MRLTIGIKLFASLIASVCAMGFFIQASVYGSLPPLTERTMNQLETTLYGVTFLQDSPEVRTQRLERSILGRATSGELPPRIEFLENATATLEDKPFTSGYLRQLDATLTHSETDVIRFDGQAPTLRLFTLPEHEVAAIEQRLLKAGYPDLPSSQRLSQLEVRLFGRSSSGMAYSEEDRWKRIKTVLNANPDGEGGLNAINRNGILEHALPVILGGLMMVL